MDINYCQIVEMTDEEKFEMYDKLPKEDIIKMLIQANKVIDDLYEPKVVYKNVKVENKQDKSLPNFVSTNTISSETEMEYKKPGLGCSHLCYDCEHGSYCWDSECNEVENI